MNSVEQTPEGRVLIVDDAPANLLALQAVLKPVGVHLVEARSGAEAIALAKAEQFALVLLDVQMPGMDGFEVARHLRQTEASRETPIIFLTAIHRDESYSRRGYEIGGADYLLKPFDPDILRARVRSYVDLFNQRERRRVQELLGLEQARRRIAEEAAREQRLLADISAVLGSSLDIEETLESVVWRAVPELADWCAVDLVSEGGALTRHAVADSERSGDATRIGAGVFCDVSAIIASRRAAFGQRGPRAWMCVPLLRPERAMGALLLVSSTPGRTYTETDLAFAEEIAVRVAMAVENADLYARAQAAIRIREDFVSIASHELKTPLTPLKLQLASLQRRLPEDRAVILERLATADRQVEKIVELVNQLLDVSKIAAGRLELQAEWVSLGRILERVLERFASSAAGSQVRVHGEAGDAFLDPFRIEQLITNLVANAVKYGEGKPVDVELDGDAERVSITVRDQGIGIGAREQLRIFDRFERAVSTNQYGGFGLGLWIARQVVEASGGRITVTSEIGNGATFTVVLPRGREREQAARAVGG